MKKLQIIGVILALIGGLILVATLILPKDNPVVSFGSVAQSNEYHATTTPSGISAGDYLINSGSGTLGSIIVASSSASTLTILDANGSATTTVATLKASIGEGTYTFDTNIYKGLYIQVPSGYNGQYITTWR